MDQYLEFATNHVLLVSAFFMVASALLWHMMANPTARFSVEPTEGVRLINRENAHVLDVRPMAEFKQEGHIQNAENIPLNGLKNNLKKLEKYKDTPIITVCRSGSRSAGASTTLRKAGFTQTYNLRGGMLAWESAQLPVSKQPEKRAGKRK